jgi:predicted methyltransferase
MKQLLLPAIVLAALASPAPAQTVPAPVTAALADAGRLPAEKEDDARRHPGEILAFAGIKPGDKVADFSMGAGYWTRILSPLVGPNGRVYAYQPAEFIQYRAAYGTEQDAAVAGRANVTPSREPLAQFAFPDPLDAVIVVNNYHDLHLNYAPKDMAAGIARKLFAALKPGGVLLLIDHTANADPGFAAPQALHRIDPAATRAEIEGAGFRFDGESQVLRNPADPRTATIFDEAIKGKTDQFVYRFRKPK